MRTQAGVPRQAYLVTFIPNTKWGRTVQSTPAQLAQGCQGKVAGQHAHHCACAPAKSDFSASTPTPKPDEAPASQNIPLLPLTAAAVASGRTVPIVDPPATSTVSRQRAPARPSWGLR